MSNAPKRIDLGDGDWWAIETKPSVRQGRMIDAIKKPEEDEEVDASLPAPDDYALAILTTEWSFSEDVTAENVADRQMDHLIAALEVLVDDIIPFLENSTQRVQQNQSLSDLSLGKPLKATRT